MHKFSVLLCAVLWLTVQRYDPSLYGFVVAEPSWFGLFDDDDDNSNLVDETEFVSNYYGNGSSSLWANVSVGMEESVARLRKLVQHDIELERDQYDPVDVTNFLDGPDWYVTRYLQNFKRPPTEEDLVSRYELVKENLAWRKEWQMADAALPGQFPCEFYLTRENHVTHDRDGRLVRIWEPSHAVGGQYNGKFLHDYFRFLYSVYDAVDEAAGWDTWSEVITFRFMGYASIPSRESLATLAPMLDRYAGKATKINIVDLSPKLAPVMQLMHQLNPPSVRDRVTFYMGEYEKFKVVKKRDTPKFMDGRLPLSRSLVAFLPRSSQLSNQSQPLKSCISLADAARLHGWSADQVDLFLQYNRKDIKSIATAVSFPLDRLTLD